MPAPVPAKLLRIQISDADTFEGKPLYEKIVAKCRELGIAGATVFRGLEMGEAPILIDVVDTAENLERLAPAVEAMLDTGITAISEVRMLRMLRSER